jgi:hypothetical protein
MIYENIENDQYNNSFLNMELSKLNFDLLGFIFLDDYDDVIKIKIMEYEKYDVQKYDMLLFSKHHIFEINENVKRFMIIGFNIIK